MVSEEEEVDVAIEESEEVEEEEHVGGEGDRHERH